MIAIVDYNFAESSSKVLVGQQGQCRVTLEEIDEFCHVNGGRVQGNEYEQLMEDALGSVEALSVRKPIPSMRGLGCQSGI